ANVVSVQLSLKRVCPNRSFNISSNDNSVTGAAACSLFLDVGALFTGAARWAATFFTGSVLERSASSERPHLRSKFWLGSRRFDTIGHQRALSTIQGTAMAIGTVKWFNATKGYGFIQPDDGGKDAFVHISAVERSGLNNLVEGQKIQFDLVSDRRSGKMSADNLKAVD